MGLLTALALAEAVGSLTVTVSNVRNGRGKIYVELCSEKQFLKENCPYHITVPSRAGSTTVTLENIPAGIYGAQAFHDENSNGEVDKGLFGLIPKEGVGFSHNALRGMSRPKWQVAKFSHSGQAESIQFQLYYFSGEKGPNPIK